MAWFNAWWQSLELAGQIMACAAIPMTVVMILQLILMIIGIEFGHSDSDFDADGTDAGDAGDHEFDSDHDYDHDHDHDHDSGGNHDAVRFFTIRGIVAFFAIGGWAGLAALTANIPVIWSIWIALLSGVAAMILASLVIRFALRMQSSGNINLSNAMSLIADVYITIPPSRSNIGKVTLILQERFVEVDAVTDSENAIKPKTRVEIVGIAGTDCLVVSPLREVEAQSEEGISEN